jgi:predicted ATPase
VAWCCWSPPTIRRTALSQWLQRQNFLPTIELIKRELDVLNVDGGNDYRLRELTREPLFMVPDDAAAGRAWKACLPA